jgi:hypothetical protein
MMNKLVFLGALPAALAFPPAHISAGHGASTTSTVYATSTYTVTSCGPTVTNCPYGDHGPVVVTEVVPVSTTVCAVEEEETSTVYDWGCNTSTSFSECVHTITSTLAPFPETTKIPVTTITTTEVSTEYSTCVHTVTNATKPYVATTLYPLTTVTKEITSTSYSDCVHTVTNATTVYPETTVVPVTTYTVCPVKPTGSGKPFPIPEGGAPTWPAGVPKPTGSFTKTAAIPVVTAGAASFGASGALILGAAVAALVL